MSGDRVAVGPGFGCSYVRNVNTMTAAVPMMMPLEIATPGGVSKRHLEKA